MPDADASSPPDNLPTRAADAVTAPQAPTPILGNRVSLPPDVVLALSDEREMWLRRVLRAEADGFARGYAAAAEPAYAQGRADERDDWMDYHAPARQAARERAGRPDYIQLEILRYAPRGWNGKIPAHLINDAQARRRWLCGLTPRQPMSIARLAQIKAGWDQAAAEHAARVKAEAERPARRGGRR